MENCIFPSYVNFLRKYGWLFDFQMTNLLTEQVLDKIPHDWLKHFEEFDISQLHNIVLHKIQDGWPEDLRLLVGTCARLKLHCRCSDGPVCRPEDQPPTEDDPPSHPWSDSADEARCISQVQVEVGCVHCDEIGMTARPGSAGDNRRAAEESSLDREMSRGVSLKKRHELNRLVPCLKQLCSGSDVDLVVDFGAGLGYLGERVRLCCHLPYVGLESDAVRVQAARDRHRRLPVCRGCLRVRQCHVTGDITHQQLTALLADDTAACTCADDVRTSPLRRSLCWTGLHACGNLSPLLLRLFLQSPDASCILLLSCCYHKMVCTSAGHLELPMSAAARAAGVRVSQYSRRLACQRAAAGWCLQTEQQHRRHARSAVWRALLQLVVQLCADSGAELRPVRRHGIHQYGTFLEYVASALVLADGAWCRVREVSETVWREFEAGQLLEGRVELLAALQQCVQPVLEAVMLLDRAAYLQEHGVHARIVRVFDEDVSPRCWAVVAQK